eukprot:scaffold49244_cov191-Isochrysis_galbana.AAC.2
MPPERTRHRAAADARPRRGRSNSRAKGGHLLLSRVVRASHHLAPRGRRRRKRRRRRCRRRPATRALAGRCVR